LAIQRDITEEKQAEEKIKSLLKDKEMLLKEVHHRIKNNMNTMTTLLELQSKSQSNTRVAVALADAANRMRAMQVLYENLYLSTDFQDISVPEYLHPLVDRIIRIFPNCGSVQIDAAIDEFTLDAKRASSVGIIFNELLTNIMKYAFPSGERGIIEISASLNERHAVFTVRDNGVGIPETIAIQNTTGFGLQLIGMLADQLDGSIRIERDKGTKFVLEFDV
jgi:two-component sensor histidine kinase